MQFSCKLIYNHLDCRVHYFHVSEPMPIIGVCGNNQRDWCNVVQDVNILNLNSVAHGTTPKVQFV
jgi:hypothetical protein